MPVRSSGEEPLEAERSNHALRSSSARSHRSRRATSERRHRDRKPDKDTEMIIARRSKSKETNKKDLKTPPSSVDSGAGAEDEGSDSQTAASEDFQEMHEKSSRARSSIKRKDTGSASKYRTGLGKVVSDPENSSLKRKSSGKRNSRSSTSNSNEPLTHPNHTATTSDSAVSTSILSTSGISTPTESRVFSSPNLSDYSKTSISPRHTHHYPPLSRALRKKQERLKRELDLKEARFKIERQQFIADTYRHRRIVSAKQTDSTNTMNTSGARRKPLHKSLSVDSGMPVTKSSVESPSSRLGSRKGRKTLHYSDAKIESQNFAPSNDGNLGGSERRLNDKNDRLLSTILSGSYEDDNHDKTENCRDDRGENDSQYSSKTSPTPDSRVASCNDKPEQFGSTDKETGDSSVVTTTVSSSTSDKKQRRKSQKYRSSSRQKQNGDTNTNINDADTMNNNNIHSVDLNNDKNYVNEDEPRKISSTDSEDVFDKVARKLEENIDNQDVDVDKRMEQAIVSIGRDGMPDIPSTEEMTETGLLDWRAVFRVEMMRLRREVNEFRTFCHKQITIHGGLIRQTPSEKQPLQSENQELPVSDTTLSVNEVLALDSRAQQPIVADQLRDLQTNLKLFQKKQQMLDLETELLEQEERLAEKQNHLEEYEKEILEVESMLNHRQAICDKRQKTLLTLDEELQTLRTELEETREQIAAEGSIPESNSERARKNWDMVKRNLMDEQKLLETTVQKYRSELAAATSTIAGKDILISRLQSVVMQNEEEITNRDKRIKQLESKLSVALSETKVLMDQIPSSSQRDLNSVASSSKPNVSEQGVLNPRKGSSSDSQLESSQGTSWFRSSGKSFYRRPSSQATSGEHADEEKTGIMNGRTSPHGFRSSSRKRHSVSDNAISRLTLSTPRSETSSACSIQ